MTYTVIVNGETLYTGDDLEDAIRSWDAKTHCTVVTSGEITVRSPLRDGYILHVADGHVYLNPNLADTRAA